MGNAKKPIPAVICHPRTSPIVSILTEKSDRAGLSGPARVLGPPATGPSRDRHESEAKSLVLDGCGPGGRRRDRPGPTIAGRLGGPRRHGRAHGRDALRQSPPFLAQILPQEGRRLPAPGGGPAVEAPRGPGCRPHGAPAEPAPTAGGAAGGDGPSSRSRRRSRPRNRARRRATCRHTSRRRMHRPGREQGPRRRGSAGFSPARRAPSSCRATSRRSPGRRSRRRVRPAVAAGAAGRGEPVHAQGGDDRHEHPHRSSSPTTRRRSPSIASSSTSTTSTM